MNNLWITYRLTYGIPTPDPREVTPTYYTGIGLYNDELSAFRAANAGGMKVVPIVPGQTLEQAIAHSAPTAWPSR